MKEAILYEKVEKDRVHCFLCAHGCRIAQEAYGFCGVRKNIEGKLYTQSYGKLIAGNADPVEKKPLYHFLPATETYSIAAMGCNFRCGFCQNWQISQISKNEASNLPLSTVSPETIVNNALQERCRSISFTYTEPTIFLEYALEIAMIAKSSGLSTIFVTNGFMTDEALATIRPYLDACNVDLKAFSDEFYHNHCQGRLEPVLQSIRNIKKRGVWIEITTLLIPGENDSEEEIEAIASFIASVDINIPWHVSRFIPHYEFSDRAATPAKKVFQAVDIGYRAGLRYVYPGNVDDQNDTKCHNCKELLISRKGFSVKKKVFCSNACPKCGTTVPGVFE